jgi:hypothetical protein
MDPSLDSHYKTPNWNASAKDHHWVVAQQPIITAKQATEIDDLFRNRWRTLLSVDDLGAAVLWIALCPPPNPPPTPPRIASPGEATRSCCSLTRFFPLTHSCSCFL